MVRLLAKSVLMLVLVSGLICAAGMVLGRLHHSRQLAYLGSIGAIHLVDVDRAITLKLIEGLRDIPIGFNWSPDGERIAYILLNDGHYDLYLFDFRNRYARRYPRRILSGLPSGLLPSWSPDSAAFAFVSKASDLCTYTLTSLQTHCLNLNNVASPVWSPDGKQIAYVQGQQLYVTDFSGTPPRRVDDLPPMSYSLTWSQDGLAYTSRPGQDDLRDVFVRSADAGKIRNLTQGTRGYSFGVKWSPAGARLVYNAQRGSSFDIYLYDLVQDTEFNLTENTAYEGNADWSPDGEWVAYISDRNSFLAVYIQPAQQNLLPTYVDVGVSYAVAWRPVWR